MKVKQTIIFTVLLLIGFVAQMQAQTKIWCIGEYGHECDVIATLNLADSTLVISGTGNMDMGVYDTPWMNEDLSDEIKHALIIDSVKNVGNGLLMGCQNLISVTMGNSVTAIEEYAFAGCSKLASVTIGSHVNSIGYNAFSYCSNLTSVIIPNGVIGSRAFSGCSGLIFVSIGSGVTAIGGDAFTACTGLTSVTIGSNVATIGNYAFDNCTSLTRVINHSETAQTINANVFGSGEVANDTLYVPSVSNYNSVDVWKDFGKILPVTPVTSVSLDGCTSTLTLDSVLTLVADVSPLNAVDKTVIWGSSNTAIARVDNAGAVRAVSVGTAKISVITVDGDYSDTCTVTVVYAGSDSITLSDNVLTLTLDSSALLTAVVMPTNADQSMTWSSSDLGVATVSDGVVVAVSAGEAKIVATSFDGGNSDTCTVTVVYAGSDSITLSDNALTLTLDSSALLTAVVMPTNADLSVIWSSSDLGVATVSDGVVVAVSAGEAKIVATSFDGGNSDTCTVTVVYADIDSIRLNYDTLELALYSNVLLTAVVMPTNADQSITWSSSDTDVATVSDGVVVGISFGTAKISVTTIDGSYSDTCVVTVVYANSQSITLSDSALTLILDSSALLTAVVMPAEANQSITWSSSDLGVATVSDGVVVAVSVGEAKIVATTFDGGHSDTCTVTVVYAGSDSIRLSDNELTLTLDSSALLTAVVMPAEANQSITWSSSDVSVATVSDGVVVAVSVGEAKIVATTFDGCHSDTCTVTVVYASSESITLSDNALTLTLDSSALLTAVVMPTNANQSITWSSSDLGVATVSDGIVVAVSVGEAKIVATTFDGGNSDTCTVTVIYASSESITLSDNALTLTLDSSALLTAVVMPTNANQSVTWSSSDLGVATVSDGIVVAVSVGEAKIVATTFDGGNSDTCTVTVVYASSDSITLSDNELTLTLDSSALLTAVVMPTNANQSITWSSSDLGVATVSDGVVVAVSVGEAKIVATTFDGGNSDTCTVTVVYAGSESITLSDNALTLTLDSSALLTAVVMPANTNQSITWSSSDLGVATVTDGVVVAVSVGEAEIVVTTADGLNSDTCVVTVLPQPISADTALQNITIVGEYGDISELNPAFHPNIYEYTVLLPCPVEDKVLHIIADYPNRNAITFIDEADVDGVITISADEAGDHRATIMLILPDGEAKTYTITFRQRASSELLRRLWDDMIAVNLNEETNGGYEFVKFKWYIDDEPTGDTGEYLYIENNLANDGKYHVELTTSTGKVISTCPYIHAVLQNAGIKIYPNPIVTGNILTIEANSSTSAQDVSLYDITGHLLQTYPLNYRQMLQCPIMLPHGIYIVRIGNESQKFVVVKL
ncbi:MAG: Ig-like domain-containing protein [Bacteroidales bacterium]|nr:Ig-like domain-containing protein [Bacteroidales bacterium]